jgi:hypothetical protein
MGSSAPSSRRQSCLSRRITCCSEGGLGYCTNTGQCVYVVWKSSVSCQVRERGMTETARALRSDSAFISSSFVTLRVVLPLADVTVDELVWLTLLHHLTSLELFELSQRGTTRKREEERTALTAASEPCSLRSAYAMISPQMKCFSKSELRDGCSSARVQGEGGTTRLTG